MRIIFLVALCLCFSVNTGFSWTIESVSKELTLKPGINLVFCSFNYSDKKDFSGDIEVLLERLEKTRPFDELMDALGVWWMEISKDEEIKIFKQMQGFPPIKVRKDFLNDISSSLKTSYKLIIIDALGSVSCAELSSVDKMSLIILGKRRYIDKNSFAKGFLHELGHSLGLREECVDCGELCPPGPPNCATSKEEAKNWWGDLVGRVARVHYIRGCGGNKDYIRPTIASLMNDTNKAEDFGPVNERYLREVLSKN